MNKIIIIAIIFLLGCKKSTDIPTQNNQQVKQIVYSGCDSIKLNLIKLDYTDSIRLSKCLVLNGCDSLKLNLLKPLHSDSIRLSTCMILNGCDSIKLGFIKQLSRFDSIRLSKCLVLSSKDSLSLFPKQVKIGDTLGGGIVFYLLSSSDSGYDATRQHGFIVSFDYVYGPFNMEGGPLYKYAPAYTRTKIGSGFSNTKTILSDPRNTIDELISPALVATNYRGGGYNDWYLPSKDELDTLSKIQFSIGLFPDHKIRTGWSSSDYWWQFNSCNGGPGPCAYEPRRYDWINSQNYPFVLVTGYARATVRPIRNF